MQKERNRKRVGESKYDKQPVFMRDQLGSLRKVGKVSFCLEWLIPHLLLVPSSAETDLQSSALQARFFFQENQRDITGCCILL